MGSWQYLTITAGYASQSLSVFKGYTSPDTINYAPLKQQPLQRFHLTQATVQARIQIAVGKFFNIK